MRTATVLLIGLFILAAASAVAVEKNKPYVDPVLGPAQLLDCSNAIPIGCGDSVTGTNVGAPNNVNYYSCVGYNESAGEVVYEFVVPAGQCYEVTISMTPAGCDLDLFFLASCDENDCLDYSGTIGTEEIVTECLEEGTYYIVVDGYGGAECGYTLSVTCVDCDCPVAPCCPFDYVCCWVDFNVEHCNLVMLPCEGAPVWEWGVPVGIPDIGCDDVVITKVLGTILAGDYPVNAGEIAMSGPFMITEDCSCLELCHYYDTESGFDGGNVKVSTDAGATWQLITPNRGYDRDAYSAPMCIGGEPVFSGHQFNTTFLRDCFDLSEFIGQNVWFGFFFGSDSSVQYPGWYIKWIKTGNGGNNPVEDTSWGAIKAMYR